MSELNDAQRAVATWGLPSSVPSGAVGNALDPAAVDLRTLTGWAASERLDGLAWAALAGRLPAPHGDTNAGAGALLDAHLTGLRASVAAEATAAWAVSVLADVGVRAYLFKGLATAHLDYPDTSWRTSFDADLVVRRCDLQRTVDVLVRAGCTREIPPLHEWWERRFARAVVLRAPSGVELDVHATIAEGYFGAVLDHDALLADHEEISLGGVTCRAFSPPGRLLGSAYAVVLSRGPGIRLLRDLAQQLLVTGADWNAARALAGEGDVVIAEACRRLGDAFGARHPSIEWAATVRTDGRPARALEFAERAKTRGWSADAHSTAMALSYLDRARFYAGIALPSGKQRRTSRRWLLTFHARRTA